MMLVNGRPSVGKYGRALGQIMPDKVRALAGVRFNT